MAPSPGSSPHSFSSSSWMSCLAVWLAPALVLLAAGGCGDEGGAATGKGADAGADDAGGAGDVEPADAAADGSSADADAGDRDAGPDALPDGSRPLTPEQAALLTVPPAETWELPGLGGEVQVLRTEAGIPHIYAENRRDLGLVLGFTLARDRYFLLDLQRRFGLGTLSELLGDAALPMDVEARGTGMAALADRLLAVTTPALLDYLDGVAEGINAYQARVAAGELPLPREIQLAGALLGLPRPAELMKPFSRRDLTAVAATVFYNTVFETGDVARAAAAARLPGLFAGAANEELRRRGFAGDLWESVTPLFERSSTPGFGLQQDGDPAAAKPGPRRGLPEAAHRGMERRRAAPAARPAAGKGPGPAPLPAALLARTARRLEGFGRRLQRDVAAGFGSNAWAVAGRASTDGATLVAGDGHLELSVPSLMYPVALDTGVFGRSDGGELRQIGLLMSALPLLAVGTNGRVAWSMVNPYVDVTDWYAEEIRLDAQGYPASSLFAGEWRPMQRFDETYVVADVPLLGSVGRTESWPRWTTFDGRWLAGIEGRPATREEALAPGEALVDVLGELIVPGDVDEDGRIAAVSFDFVGFDAGDVLGALDGLGHAADLGEFREWTRGLVGTGLFLAAGDAAGHIFYTSYQAIPCRGYLPRDVEGVWAPGADPTLLLDGTLYGGFRIPLRDGRVVDETAGNDDPYACAIPFDEMPQALDPAAGFVFTANNDPGRLLADGKLSNDRWYLGGPWPAVRADTIARRLEQAVARGTADEEEMARIQADNASRLGELFVPYLVAAIARAKQAAAAEGPLPAAEQRLAATYRADAAAFDAVAARLEGWGEAGFPTPSGVETFYHHPTPQDVRCAVATMIFNAWLPRLLGQVFGDEGLDGAWRFSAGQTQVEALHRFLAGRGPDDPGGLASYDPATGESVFFDRLGTDEVEESDELLLGALAEALAFLRSPPAAADRGGFGEVPMDGWLWGLRHQVRFESLLARFLGDDPAFAIIASQFSITTAVLPLAEDLAAGDPRRGLTWFPRGGDQWGVDAANPGFSGTVFSHGNGPVMRMVIALGPQGVRGRNVVPGGQSAQPDSPHFADQAALWLANDALPLRFTVDEVLAAGPRRERYVPAR